MYGTKQHWPHWTQTTAGSSSSSKRQGLAPQGGSSRSLSLSEQSFLIPRSTSLIVRCLVFFDFFEGADEESSVPAFLLPPDFCVCAFLLFVAVPDQRSGLNQGRLHLHRKAFYCPGLMQIAVV